MSPTPQKESNRKLVLTGGFLVLIMSLTWYGFIMLTGEDCANPSILAELVGKAIDSATTVILGYFGANVLDKARSFFRGTPSAPESEASR